MLPNPQVLTSLAYLTIAYIIITVQSRVGVIRKFLWLTVGILIASLAAKFLYDENHKPKNFYLVMGTSRHSTPMEIRQTYKQYLKKSNTEKNKSPDMKQRDEEMKIVYDVLMEESQRDLYNRFGGENLNVDPRQDEIKLLASVGMNYLFWGLVSYIMTIPASSRAARTWIAVILIFIFAVEVFFCLTETTLPKMMPKYMTEHEFVLYMHCAFPTILSLLRLLAEYLYVNIDKLTIRGLEEMRKEQTATVGKI